MPEQNHHANARRLSLVACLLVWLGMAVVALLATLHQRSSLQQQTDGLGEALATQTALLATELLLANDLISMNVLLNELTRNTPVSEAAVFNVDDQVVAISGASASAGQRAGGRLFAGSYVAPVVLQDAIAGYVRLNIDQAALASADRLYQGLLLAAALLMGLLSVSVMLALQRLPRENVDHDDEWHDDAAQVSAVLRLYLGNHEALLSQHWDDSLPSLPERCEQLLVDVAALYDARVDSRRSPHYQLSFSREGDAAGQAYDALCCATLFMAMSARLRQPDSDTEPLRLLAGLHMSQAGETTVISCEAEAARVAALICQHGAVNGLLVSDQILAFADADNHFTLQPWQSVEDAETGEEIPIYLLRSPAGATKALLQRQAAQLQD